MEQQTILHGIAMLPEVVAQLGISKLMLVADGAFAHLPIREQVEAVGVELVPFGQFGSNPLYEDVCKGVELFRQRGCDALLAVGGGSSIDVAKCIKLYCRMEPTTLYLEQEPRDSGVPLIAVPTTAGTGSESTRFAVIYYQGKKQSITHPSIVPDFAILEPRVLATLPPYQRACTVMDALCQGVESWWSVNSTEYSRTLSRKAVELLSARVVPYVKGTGDAETDKDVMTAANCAGQAINITQTTAPHAFSYKLTSLYGLPHGHAVGVCLPDIWQYMLEDRGRHCVDARGEAFLADIFAAIAGALRCDGVEEAVVYMRRLLVDLGLKSPSAKDRESELAMLVEAVNPVRLKNNPVGLGGEAIRQIYEQIVR